MLLNTDEGNGCLYAIALFYRPKNLPLELFLAFGKQLTMIIQFSKHIMFLPKRQTHIRKTTTSASLETVSANGNRMELWASYVTSILGEKKEIYVQSCEAKKK